MTEIKPLASISLDLDDLWTYLRTRGDPAWAAAPSYLPTFVPLALDLLQKLDLRISVFVVGADAVRATNVPYLQALAEQGHEIGNHSFSHECWMHLHTDTQLEDEIARAEEAITEATGHRPVGFRGPGYSWSPALLEVLSRRGYLYDASTLPTFLGPLARWYFLARSGLGPEERSRRAALFGTFRDGFRPIRPYSWQLQSGSRLLEIPITTFPVIKLPFHMSYLLYLGRISPKLMLAYLGSAINSCRTMGIQPSFLLHPLDLLGPEHAPGLSFFPGMAMPGERKRDLVVRALESFGETFRLVPMEHHAGAILVSGRLPERVPAFA